MSVSLSQVDWKDHVPMTNGELKGDDFTNLKAIVNRADDFRNSSVVRKCWNFATVQQAGAETIKAGRLLSTVFDSRQETVTFSGEDRQKVNLYELAALKKDYPQFKISDLSRLSFKEYNELITLLYAETSIEKKEGKYLLELLNKLNIKDVGLSYKFRNVVPVIAEIENLSTEKILGLLKEVVKKHRNLDKSRHHHQYNKDLIDAIGKKISALDPRSKKDLKLAVEYYKVLNQVEAPQLKEQLNSRIAESVRLAQNSNPFKLMLLDLATFFAASFTNLFKPDREFVVDTLRNVPDLKIHIKDKTSLAMLSELSKLDNITEVKVDGSLKPLYLGEVRKRFPEAQIL